MRWWQAPEASAIRNPVRSARHPTVALVAAISLAAILSAIGCGGGGSIFGIFRVTTPSAEYFQLVTGDLNDDQLIDVAALSSTDGDTGSKRLDLFIQDSADAGSFDLNSQQSVNEFSGALLVADLDLDNSLDIAVTQPTLENTLILRQFDAARGRYVGQIAYLVGSDAGAMAAGDIDLDGLPDLAVATSSGFVVRIQAATSPGSFPTLRTVDASLDPSDGATPGLRTLDLGDINGDGLPDVVTTRPDGARRYDHDGAVVGSFLPAQPLAFQDTPETLTIADLDLDGQLDLVGAGPEFLSVLLQQTGTPGTFLPEFTVATQSATVAQFVGIADLDDDGLPDVVVGNAAAPGTANSIQVFLQSGPNFDLVLDATYDIPDSGQQAGVLRGLSVADLNLDGLPDVIVSQTEIYVFVNDVQTPGTLAAPAQISGSGASGSPRP